MANIIEARNLHGTPWRRSDRHKREGGCVIPGEVCMGAIVLPASRGVGMLMQKSAEAIVGGDTEGPNRDTASRQRDHVVRR